DRLLLLGQEDDAEAALADLLQQLVRTDHRAGTLADEIVNGRDWRGGVQKSLWSPVGLQQGLNLTAQGWIPRTSFLDKRSPLGRRADLDGREEDRLLRLGLFGHKRLACRSYLQRAVRNRRGNRAKKNGLLDRPSRSGVAFVVRGQLAAQPGPGVSPIAFHG